MRESRSGKGGRGSRLAEKIRERVANVVLFELQDPRMGFVTVTRAELAKDLSTVKVFYSVLGDEGQRSKVAHALRDATGHIQREMAKVLDTRSVPRLELVFDESIEGTFRMEALLGELNKERLEREPAAEDAPAPTDGDDESGQADAGGEEGEDAGPEAAR